MRLEREVDVAYVSRFFVSFPELISSLCSVNCHRTSFYIVDLIRYFCCETDDHFELE